jgi:hypothetical protein
VPGRPAEGRDSVGAGRLKAWRAQSLGEGEGRVVVEGTSREVKTGDSIGGYVVKAVGPGRVVLRTRLGWPSSRSTPAARRACGSSSPTTRRGRRRWARHRNEPSALISVVLLAPALRGAA